MKALPGAQVTSVIIVTGIAITTGGSPGLHYLSAFLIIASASAVFFPGRLRLGRKQTLLLASILILALASYLPTQWFQIPAWRTALVSDASLTLPPTLSPQPWQTAQSFALLFGSISWLSYLVTLNPTQTQRRTLVQGLMFLLSGIALTSILLQANNITWPWGAEHAEQFSPFANRNQLATLCAMSLAIHVSAAASSIQGLHYRRLAWLLPGLGIALIALAMIGSRAGIALGLLGAFATLATDAWQRRSPRAITLSISLTMLGLAAVFLTDTRLTERITADPKTVWQDIGSGRLAIYQDTLSQAHALPFFGHGLGNFAQVFPFYRDLSVSEYHLRHPESDWLWWWFELGWPVVVLALLGFAMLLFKYTPRLRRHHHERRYDHALHLGLLGAALVFVLNSLIDVPAHRLGTLWAGLLVFSLILPASAKPNAPTRRNPFLATSALVACIVTFLVPNELTNRAPLAWQGHYKQALAHLKTGATQEALASFQTARFLEPHATEVPLAEAEAWLSSGHPIHAIAAWRNAMDRDPVNADTYYDRFLKRAKQDDSLPIKSLLVLAEGYSTRLSNYQANR